MPQLKIQDIKEEMESKETIINGRLTAIEVAIEEIRSNTNGTKAPVNTVAIQKELDNLRKELIGHVGVYNNHIIKQHGKVKK